MIVNKEERGRNNGKEEEEQKQEQELMQLKTQVQFSEILNMTICRYLLYVHKENLNPKYDLNNNRMTIKKTDRNNYKKETSQKLTLLYLKILYEVT